MSKWRLLLLLGFLGILGPISSFGERITNAEDRREVRENSLSRNTKYTNGVYERLAANDRATFRTSGERRTNSERSGVYERLAANDRATIRTSGERRTNSERSGVNERAAANDRATFRTSGERRTNSERSSGNQRDLTNIRDVRDVDSERRFSITRNNRNTIRSVERRGSVEIYQDDDTNRRQDTRNSLRESSRLNDRQAERRVVRQNSEDRRVTSFRGTTVESRRNLVRSRSFDIDNVRLNDNRFYREISSKERTEPGTQSRNYNSYDRRNWNEENNFKSEFGTNALLNWKNLLIAVQVIYLGSIFLTKKSKDGVEKKNWFSHIWNPPNKMLKAN